MADRAALMAAIRGRGPAAPSGAPIELVVVEGSKDEQGNIIPPVSTGAAKPEALASIPTIVTPKTPPAATGAAHDLKAMTSTVPPPLVKKAPAGSAMALTLALQKGDVKRIPTTQMRETGAAVSQVKPSVPPLPTESKAVTVAAPSSSSRKPLSIPSPAGSLYSPKVDNVSMNSSLAPTVSMNSPGSVSMGALPSPACTGTVTPEVSPRTKQNLNNPQPMRRTRGNESRSSIVSSTNNGPPLSAGSASSVVNIPTVMATTSVGASTTMTSSVPSPPPMVILQTPSLESSVAQKSVASSKTSSTRRLSQQGSVGRQNNKKTVTRLHLSGKYRVITDPDEIASAWKSLSCRYN